VFTLTSGTYFNQQLDTHSKAQHNKKMNRQEDLVSGTTKDGTTGRTQRHGHAGENLTYLRIVEEVTGSGISQQELGNAVGASVRTVQNWASGEAAPRSGSRERLLDLKYIVEELRSVYTEEGTEIWLHARNRNLGSRRPIDLITAGEVDAVIEEVQRLAGAM
jgi:DNA-binding transcriptional regulator YiaG